jgi:hypothetical protein
MFKAIRILAFGSLLLTGGCASEQPNQILTPFLDNDFQTWKQSGSYTVSGQAFFRQPNGQTITCAGQAVSLMPLTGYNMELSKLLESGHGMPPNYERRAHRYDRTVMCDGGGRFTFEGIPALGWLLVTRVNWQESTTLSAIPYIGGPDNKGGWMFREIIIESSSPGNAIRVMMSNQDFVADQD